MKRMMMEICFTRVVLEANKREFAFWALIGAFTGGIFLGMKLYLIS